MSENTSSTSTITLNTETPQTEAPITKAPKSEEKDDVSGEFEDKGSILNPYSSTDTFLIKAYQAVPWSHLSPEGRQVEKPITFKISNVRLITPITYVDSVEKKEYSNRYLIAFDCDIEQSSVTEMIQLNMDYLKVFNCNTNYEMGYWMDGDYDVYYFSLNNPEVYPDGCTYFAFHGIVPIEGTRWSFADIILTENNGELAYIVFDYCGEDAAFHQIFVKVN